MQPAQNAAPQAALQTTAAAPRGVLTGVPLADVRRLRLPPAPDPFGRLRPPPDRAALSLSLELSYLTYTLDIDPWMQAGWTDISIQVDNRLQSGVTVGESERWGSERIRGLVNGWKVARARMAMREVSPVAQLMSALRQREKSDTIKAVTMAHPAGGGRYVVAIGFMGTGGRFYDWFSNFRFTTEDGFHKGFFQLTQVFEQSAPHIVFPDTAAALGRETLTLADILHEMRAPNSRFSLWMAGHSQGAAVMQVFCHRLLHVWGIPMRHVVGYGFASPTAAAASAGRDTAAYPLYHVLNSDDLVPRIGALVHLGMGLRYEADDALRAAAYGWGDTPAEAALRAYAERLFAHIQDTPTMLEAMVALLTVINEEKTEENLQKLMDKRWSVAPLDWVFSLAGDKVKDSLTRYAKVAYRALAGARMSAATVARLCEDMRPIVRAHTLIVLLTALRDRFYPPHMLVRPHGQTGAYGFIASQGAGILQPFLWHGTADGSVTRLLAAGYAAFTPAAGEGGAGRLQRRDTGRPSQRYRSVRGHGQNRRRLERQKRLCCAAHAGRRRVFHCVAKAAPNVAGATKPARRARRGGRTAH
jgi:hypothetical protein